MKAAFSLTDTRYALDTGVALSVGDAPPSEIEVILSGDYKARDLVIDDAAIDSMIANHKASGVDPAVDREHESWASLQLSPSPALGWVKSLSRRPASGDPTRSALVAQVEWTDVGAESVGKKYWRYVSAGIDLAAVDRLSKKSIGVMLDHVALVKHPFVQGMKPLSLSANQPTEEQFEMKSILKALSLKEDASEVEAFSSVDALVKFKSEVLELAGKDGERDAIGALSAMKQSNAEVIELRSQLAKIEAEATERAFSMALDQATKDGIIPPSPEHPRRAYALKLKGKAGAVEELKAYTATLDALVTTKEVALSLKDERVSDELSAEETSYCLQYGIDMKAFAATKSKKAALSAAK